MLHSVDYRPSAPLIKRHICQPARLIMAASPHWLIFMESTSLTELLKWGMLGERAEEAMNVLKCSKLEEC